MRKTGVWVSRVAVVTAVGLVLAAAIGGCGSDGPTASDSRFTPPAAGNGLGLLALELESFGTPMEMGMGGGDTDITSLFITFDSIRAYPGCDDHGITGHHHGHEGGGMRGPEAHEGDGEGPGGPCHGGGERDSTDGHYPHFEDDDGGYFEVLTDPVTVDLLDGGATLGDVLGTLEVPSGEYRHVRLHVLDAWVIDSGGDRGSVRLPDPWDEYINLMLAFTVEDGEVMEIYTILDMAGALTEDPPGSGDYLFHPVIHGEHGSGDHMHGDHDFGDHDDDDGDHDNDHDDDHGGGHGGGMH